MLLPIIRRNACFSCLFFLCLFSFLGLAQNDAARPDILIEDFEGGTYGDWTVTGDAFGPGPANGTLERQNPVSGFMGKGLVNTYYQGDRTQGTLTSTPFAVSRNYLNFLVGGGAHEWETCMNLLLDGKTVRTVVGQNNERLTWYTWDLTRLQNKEVVLQIVDRARGGWGHINIDHIVLSDTPKATPRGDPEAERQRMVAERGKVLPELIQLGVHELIYAVRMVDSDGHWYANFGTWSNNPKRQLYHDGGRLCRYNVATDEVTVLLDDPEGGVRDPQVHYDAGKILFSYRRGGQPYYHLYEINVDGSGLRQLTDDPYDDIEPTYLPDGDIVFCSSRCNRMVNCYFVRVATIYRCDANGGSIRMLSSNIEQDNTPWPLPDGRILHQRWEYIDRSQVWFHHLWTMNPDGTDQMVYYGNMHASTVMLDAKPIPGTRQVVVSFSPGHGRNEHAGYITIVSPDQGPDNKPSARRLSNEFYRDPYPLSKDLFLVVDDSRIRALRSNGESIPIHVMPDQWRRIDGRMKIHEPRPLCPRPREHILPNRVNLAESTGTVSLEDVYTGRNMDGVKQGDIRELLVLEALPKPVNFSGGWEPISFGGTFTLERVIGTVPVEKDGSAHMELPALRSLFFVALDENGRSVKRMQSFLTLQPGESFSCVGCHEPRARTPETRQGRKGATLASMRPPNKPKPYLDVPDVYDFPRDIQPILDGYCVACHGYTKTGKGGPRNGGVILTGDRGPMYSHSYFMLTIREQFTDGRNSGGNRAPRTIGSGTSPLLDKLAGGHHGVQASAREQLVARLWIESAAPYPGTYAALGTGMVGRNGRTDGWGKETDTVFEKRCASCHKDKTRLPRSGGDDVLKLGFGGTRINAKDPRFAFSNHILFNLSRPEHSLILLVPLSSEAGGLAQLPVATRAGQPHPVVFADASDTDYQILLGAVKATKVQLDGIKRFGMPDFRPNEHYVREMKFYGILPQDLPADALVDVYAADRKYWQSLWYRPGGE